MDLQKIKAIATIMGLKSEKLEAVEKMARSLGVIKGNEISGNKDIFRNVVNQYGGSDTLQQALKKLESPMVKNALSLAGIDADQAKINALEAMRENNQPKGAKDPALMDRINKLR